MNYYMVTKTREIKIEKVELLNDHYQNKNENGQIYDEYSLEINPTPDKKKTYIQSGYSIILTKNIYYYLKRIQNDEAKFYKYLMSKEKDLRKVKFKDDNWSNTKFSIISKE